MTHFVRQITGVHANSLLYSVCVSWGLSSLLDASEHPHLMLYANPLTLRAPGVKKKTASKSEQERAVFSARNALTRSAEVPACTQGLLMSVRSSMKIHSWYKNGGFQTVVIFQHEAWGRTWMVLIRHWNLFVYDRWRIKNGGGRWHLGGRPGLSILCWSAAVDRGREEDNRWRTKEKPAGRVTSGNGDKRRGTQPPHELRHVISKDWFVSVKESEFLNGNSHLQ